MCFFVTFLFVGCSAQKMITHIDQKLDSNSNKEIVLVKIINDSRCPVDVQCVWAGEVVFEMAVYENNKIIEQTVLKLSSNNQEEILLWFTQRLPVTKKPIKNVSILPYPRDGVSIMPSDYFVKLGY